MVTTSRRNRAEIKPVERDSNLSPNLLATEVIKSHTSLQYIDLLSSNFYTMSIYCQQLDDEGAYLDAYQRLYGSEIRKNIVIAGCGSLHKSA